MSVKQSHRKVGIAVDKEKRQRDDFYPSPPEATLELLSKENFSGAIWEPACGDGAISKILIEHGHEVVSTDLVARGYGESGIDFLMEWKALAPNIITNPPFKLSEQFVTKALSLTTGKVAILQKVSWLAGQERKKMFTATPLARVRVFSYRLKFERPEWEATGNGGMIDYAWFVWEHGHQGPPELSWF